MGALFLDIENDGDLDLYLTHDGNQPTSSTSTMERGRSRTRRPLGASISGRKAWGGYGLDHDGYLDLYISNNLPNDLFLNPTPAGRRQHPALHEHHGEAGVGTGAWVGARPSSTMTTMGNATCMWPTSISSARTRTRRFPGEAIESQFSGYATVVADFDVNGTEDLLVVNALVNTNPVAMFNEDLEPLDWVRTRGGRGGRPGGGGISCGPTRVSSDTATVPAVR